MKIFFCLLLAGVCTLLQAFSFSDGHTSSGCDPDLEVPQEEKVQVMRLTNGITTCIQENEFPENHASLRVVWKQSPQEQGAYALDTPLDDFASVEKFFQDCCEKMTEIKGRIGDHLAVIAVGNFPLPKMQEMIGQFFADLPSQKEGVLERAPIEIGLSGMTSDVALRIDYSPAKHHVRTFGDLREKWKQVFLQELFQQRMERCAKYLQESWCHPHPHFLYPVPGYALSEEQDSENVFSFLLWEVELIKQEGYSETEFAEVRSKILHQLQYLFSKAQALPDHAMLASYYADQFVHGGGYPIYASFITASEELVAQIQLAELMEQLPDFLEDGNRSIQISYPSQPENRVMTVDDVEGLIQKVSDLAHFDTDAHFPQDGVLLLAQHEERGPLLFASDKGADAFFQLPLTDGEMRNIDYIITNMAEKNLLQLAFKKSEMEKRGKKITHVHPLRFMGYILSTPHLRKCIYEIEKSSFKWNALIEGFADRMKEESKKGNVLRHVPGFAELLMVTPDQVTSFVYKKQWDGLVRFLISND